jgi:hypothetical protein
MHPIGGRIGLGLQRPDAHRGGRQGAPGRPAGEAGSRTSATTVCRPMPSRAATFSGLDAARTIARAGVPAPTSSRGAHPNHPLATPGRGAGQRPLVLPQTAGTCLGGPSVGIG